MKQIKMRIPVSAGELIDKITILEIKSLKIKDKIKLKSVKAELQLLQKELVRLSVKKRKLMPGIKKLRDKLYMTNLALWNIENVIRKLEAQKDFGSKFVDNARSVYFKNDRRFEIKSEINKLYGSVITEVKEYKKYK